MEKHIRIDHIDGLVQEDVTPLLTHWSYVFAALTHRYSRQVYQEMREVHPGSGFVLVSVPDFTHILLGYSTGTQDIFTIAPIHRKIPCLHFYPMFT